MSRRDDDDFLEGLALYWLLHEELEGHEDEQQQSKPRKDGSGCLGVVIVLLILFVFAKDHPISIAIVNLALLYFLWKYGMRLLKFCVKGLFSVACSAIFGSLVLFLLHFMIGYRNFSFIDFLFTFAAYIGSFLYVYLVTCPWITAKAKEIVNKGKINTKKP